MSIRIVTLSVGPLDVNCYLVGCDEHEKCAVVDPGDSPSRILAAIEKEGWSVTAVVNTHTHADHTGANKQIVEATGAPLVMHEADVALAADPAMRDMVDYLGLTRTPPPDRIVVDGDVIAVCDCLSLTVMHTPGHTRGGICLMSGDRLLTGDTLFKLSIGRSDLAGGDGPTLLNSIRTRLLPLPDRTIIYPGHGDPSTMGEEKRMNPFLVGMR
jgi:glyoxylase-like metal-dependent hydrolase (beta-lactamase superfamily II)